MDVITTCMAVFHCIVSVRLLLIILMPPEYLDMIMLLLELPTSRASKAEL